MEPCSLLCHQIMYFSVGKLSKLTVNKLTLVLNEDFILLVF